MSTSSAWKEQCKKIFDAFRADKQCEPFYVAVPWKEYGLFDYPTIVKNPMDFEMVGKKMRNYANPKEFADDMRLVFHNCMLYNQEGSDYYVLADRMAKSFEKKMLKVVDTSTGAIGDGSGVKPPTFPEKAKFSEGLYDVTPDVLGTIVSMLDEKCEAALDKTTMDEVEISIDLIDAATFREVDAYLKSQIALLKQGGGGAGGRKRPGDAPLDDAKRLKAH